MFHGVRELAVARAPATRALRVSFRGDPERHLSRKRGRKNEVTQDRRGGLIASVRGERRVRRVFACWQ